MSLWPVIFSQRVATSGGTGAPPEKQRRKDERSNSRVLGKLTMATFTVAMRVVSVQRYRSMARSTVTRSKRPMVTRVAPRYAIAFIWHSMPVMWNQGNTPRATSSAAPPTYAYWSSQFATRLRCVISAAFGYHRHRDGGGDHASQCGC